jgi:hypothetical protein
MVSRGQVVSAILSLAKHAHIPALLVTGTPQDQLRTPLNAYYGGRLLIVRSGPGDRCWRFTARVDDEATFHEMVTALYMKSALATNDPAGVIVFANSLPDVWTVFRTFMNTIGRGLHPPPVDSPCAHGQCGPHPRDKPRLRQSRAARVRRLEHCRT